MSYKDYAKVCLGRSDTANLIARTNNNYFMIAFDDIGTYSAYLVDEHATIPPHFHFVNGGYEYLSIFDDTKKVTTVYASEIKVYRGGLNECIIQAKITK